MQSNNFEHLSDIGATNSARNSLSLKSIPSFSQEQTANFRIESWPDITTKVKAVIAFMQAEKLNVVLFLDAFSWVDEGCIADPIIKQARTQLMTSAELPQILQRWWKPPRSKKSHGARADGARILIEKLSVDCTIALIRDEMSRAKEFLQSTDIKFSAVELLQLRVTDMIGCMKKGLPNLWDILCSAIERDDSAISDFDAEEKDYDKVSIDYLPRIDTYSTQIVMMCIAILAYTRNQNCNLLQRMLAIYFKFNGLTTRGFDSLHYLGVVMSMKWTTNVVKKIASEAQESLLALRDQSAWFLCHDNLNIPFHVYSQRVEQHTHFDSGTAGTCFVIPHCPPLSPNLPADLQISRANGLRSPITMGEIAMLDNDTGEKLQPFFIWEVLKCLFNAKEFGIGSYVYSNDVPLVHPEPLDTLPHGPDHITKQFMLGTVEINESTYEGTDKLIEEWFSQLNLASAEDHKLIAETKAIPFVGDQLTVERERGIQKYRAEDFNAYDRWDFLVPVFGWLHGTMAFANSLYKQYGGTPAGRGVKHAIVLLQRKGLARVLTKGPFFHDLNELLHHMAYAHIRCCWKQLLKVNSLSELRKYTPSQLRHYAKQIVNQFASTDAIERCRNKPVEDQDELQQQSFTMLRDLLYYMVFCRSVKEGDIGVIEHMLPYLLFRFQGGGNHKYAAETLELLQCLRKEWPSELREFVRRHVWLVNFKGKRDSFVPVDMAQEHNIRDIKVTYLPDSPSKDWAYLKKISWAIPVIRALNTHVEEETETLSRGKKHGIPDSEKDIFLLEQSYTTSEIHIYTKGRMVEKDDMAEDIVACGFDDLQEGKGYKTWKNNRLYVRSRGNIWSSNAESSSDVKNVSVEEEGDEYEDVEENEDDSENVDFDSEEDDINEDDEELGLYEDVTTSAEPVID